jgi:rare lipoprotein A
MKRHAFLGLFLLALPLAGCGQAELAAHVIKHTPVDQADRGGRYQVGRPYEIRGVTYTPEIDYSYDETGIASWYGPGFQGRPTANGERFDTNLVTAAHKTLPLPSLCRVTNLENGRSIVVRVNDRGPFVAGRIIDMSREGAELLGFRANGIARVRVQIMPEESFQLAMQLDPAAAERQRSQYARAVGRGGASRTQVAESAPPPPRRPDPEPVFYAPPPPPLAADEPVPRAAPAAAITTVDLPVETVSLTSVTPTRLYVQVGAFTVKDNADQLARGLASLGTVVVSPAIVDGRDFWRVRFGPVQDVAEADRLLEEAIARGHAQARIVVDNLQTVSMEADGI